MKLILLGYMASGKTSIGKRLAKKLDLPFIDLDDYIVKKEKMTIPELFKGKGEIYFRKKESQFLEELLKKEGQFVLALGGGTPCYGKNMEIVNTFGISFYLKSSIINTYKKLSKTKNKEKRPLISNISNDNLMEFIAKHLFERNPYYEQAKHTVLIDGKNKKKIAKEIILTANSY